MTRCHFAALCWLTLLTAAPSLHADDADRERLQLNDVFQLEYATDPQISPNGARVVYVRNFMDVMKDRRRSNLWIVDVDGSNHRPLTTGNQNDSSPQWSPDGSRVAYVSNSDETSQVYCRWVDSGETAKLTSLTTSPKNLRWSPDGKQLAFTMFVEDKPEPLVKLPAKPQGAEWADPPKLISRLKYRNDGRGYAKAGYYHLFVLPAEGGTPRQLTSGDFDHDGAPSWSPDSRAIIFSSNRHDDWQRHPLNSEVYELSLADGSVRALTDRNGGDFWPVVSPDGSKVAYVGFDDESKSYHLDQLYVMNRDGSGSRPLTGGLDRDVAMPRWSPDGDGVYFTYDDQGDTRIGFAPLDGEVRKVIGNVGGTTIGRPYSGGAYSVAQTGAVTYTHATPTRPADVAIAQRDGGSQQLTRLNDDLLGHKTLGQVEELWFDSAVDGRKIQAWLATPPDFDPNKKYPLVLEIHGGPFANYGAWFSTEVQLYAAAGYVVLYVNPRGSTGYGREFAELIHHDYPGDDYGDLMSAVDAAIDKGYVDPDNLFVTGGSGGGILTAWIVTQTDRFRAAVSAKPVINWYSFVLTADAYPFFSKYWFPAYPWEKPDEYLRRSPLSHVANVKTPTMLLTGEQDYRTPISESEQFYQALQLLDVDTALVRVPGASHGIVARPSHMMAKVAYILAWFEKYRE